MYRAIVNWILFYSLAMIVGDSIFRFLRRGKPGSGGAPKADKLPTLVRWLRIAVNTAGAVSLAFVATSGFSALLDGSSNKMTGDRLIWHVTTAPAFAISAVVVTIFWAHKNRFGAGVQRDYSTTFRKLFFWTAVAFTIPTILSVIAAMYPILGSDKQEILFAVHRYCALAVTGSGLLFAYFALVSWRERSDD